MLTFQKIHSYIPFFSYYLFLFCTILLITGNDVDAKKCRQFTQNNRPVYECQNTTFPQGISSVPSGTMILTVFNSTIPQFFLLNNSEIVTVTMNFCKLSHISPDAFIFATNLRALDLSHNSLRTLEFRADSHFSIRQLILSYNKFEIVPLLQPLRQLTYLDLSNNKIRYLTEKSLLLPNLEIVDLSFNELQVVRPTDYGEMIRIVELDGCPWRCDCHLRDFVEFQRKSLIAKSPRCYEPIQIRGTKWDELSLKDFACGPVITAPLRETLQFTEGETASLLCIVWGDPSPTVHWYRNGSAHPLTSDGDRILVEAAASNNGTSYHMMHIRQIVPEDQTTYWCKATTGFVAAVKHFVLQVDSLNGEEDQQFSLIYSSGDSTAKSPENTEGQKIFGQVIQPIWQLLLLIVMSFALLLFLVVCCFLLIYWCRIQSLRKGTTYQSEKKSLRTTTAAVTKLSLQNESDEIVQIQNSKVPLLQNGESSPGCTSFRNNEQTVRKAPLAQYDRDTSILPLVQTSL